jgi:prepilin-type N-terminal cleavage/methylation domain-containing protein
MNIHISKKEKGFTLLELLVVVALIVILAGIVIAALSPARERGRDARRQTDIKQIQLALEAYFQVNNEFPTNIYAGGILEPNYINKVPVDPVTGNPYSYAYDDSGGAPYDFHLGAIFENSDNIPENDLDLDSSGAFTNGFKGDSPDCAAGVGTDMCFDVRP